MKLKARIYKCQRGGYEQIQKTNHKGKTYSYDRVGNCPKCMPYQKYIWFGGKTTWEYVKEVN